MELLVLLVIPLSYLLGSIPSAYIAGRLCKINLLEEGDGHISATAVYCRLGRLPFIIVALADAAKGMLTVYISQIVTENLLIIMAAGMAAVIGHCWSIFIKFQGGLGAAVTCGILFILAPIPFLLAGIIAIMVSLITRKSSIGTITLVSATAVVLLILYFLSSNTRHLILAPYPFVLILAQYLKRLQIKNKDGDSKYKNELFQDLKRTK